MLPYNLDNVRNQPGLFVPNGEYSEIVMFVEGVDFGVNHKLFEGFREWLILRLGKIDCRYWNGLVLEVSGIDYPAVPGRITVPDEKLAIEAMFVLLEEFLADRARVGLRAILESYSESRERWEEEMARAVENECFDD